MPTISQPSSQAAKAPAELWEAIKTIVSLQNQAPPLVSVNRDEPLPLSFTQERLWFLDRLTGSNAAYNIPFALQVRGDLNISALERSLQEIIRRHEALRTNFTSVGDNSVQLVTKHNWNLKVRQLPQLSVSEREAEIQKLCIEEAKAPFALSSEPLLRATLIELDKAEYLLLITVHHIVFDGWSEGVFWRELAELYQAFSNEQSSPIAALPVQYADFAVWQRQWLQGELLDHLLAYWRGQLGNNLPELELPLDRPKTAKSTRPSASYQQTLPAELTKKLKTLSRQEGATTFALLLAAFKVLLHRYTEQDNLFVCSPIANRNRRELKNLIGYFVNLLILRSELSGNLSFSELLTQVRQTVSGAYAHQDLPVQQLVNNLDLGQAPLSQVMFVLQNTVQQTPKLSDLEVRSRSVDNGTADFDLSLSMSEVEGTLIGVWKYNTDLFNEATIANMGRHFQLLLEEIICDPTQPLSSLLVLNEGERQELSQKRANYRLKPEVKRAEGVKPRNPLELQLMRVWEQILGSDRLGVTDNFFEVGGSSLLAFRLIAAIERAFDKKLPLTALLQAPTIEKLAELLRQGADTVSCSWLTPQQPNSSQLPFFCIAPAGNSGMGFAPIVLHLGNDRPFYVPQALGLEGETEPHNRVEDMAAHYIKEIRTIQPEGPYLLGGRCFGGIVAFEMALQLTRQGQKVALLALIDGALPPHLYLDMRNSDGSIRKKSLADLWQSFVFFCKSGQLLTILGYKYTKLVKKFRKKRAKNQTSDPSLKNVQKVFRSHLQARAEYVPQGTFPGKIDIYASETLRIDQQDKWRELVDGGVEYHFIGGRHDTIDREPHVRVLAKELRESMDKAQNMFTSSSNLPKSDKF